MEVKKPNPPSQEASTIDEAFELAGGHGFYQFLVALGCTFATISSMLYFFSIPLFLVPPPVFECSNSTCTLPLTRCHPNATYVYKNERFNFITEYDLLCDDVKASALGSLFSVGACVGTIVFSALGDTIGRLPVLVIGQAGMIVSIGCLLVFSSYTVCVWTTISVGFFALACGPPTFTYAYDSMHSKFIPLYATYINAVYALGEVAVAALMWAGIEWRTMCYIIIGWEATFFLLLFKLKESPRYLSSKGKTSETERTIAFIASTNSHALPIAFHIKPSPGQVATSFLERSKLLFRRNMLSQLVCCCCIFMAAGFVYYGISLSVQRFEGNIYLNAILNAVAEAFAMIVSGLIDRKIGTRSALIFSLALTGCGLVGQRTFAGNVICSSICLYVAKFGVSAAFNIGYIFVGQAFPTSVKNSTLGIGILFARAGGLASPMISIRQNLMSFVSVGMCLLGTAAAFMLRQTGAEEQPLAQEKQGNMDVQKIELNTTK